VRRAVAGRPLYRGWHAAAGRNRVTCQSYIFALPTIAFIKHYLLANSLFKLQLLINNIYPEKQAFYPENIPLCTEICAKWEKMKLWHIQPFGVFLNIF